MAFSGAVKLLDLSDYISPSQACIKPLQPSNVSSGAKLNIGSLIEIEFDLPSAATSKPAFGQIKSDSLKQTAKISLNDCLACSGCITSAETVLVQMQSLSEFYSALTDSTKIHIVTVSPQTRAALANRFNISLLETARRLTAVLKSVGVKYIFDSSYGLDVALLEARAEFLRHHTAATNAGSSPTHHDASISFPMASTSAATAARAPSVDIDESTQSMLGKRRATAADALPLLTSECPGWICYAEKTLGDSVLPLISRVKSPQQIMGTLIKTHFAQHLGVSPNLIYHVAIMPCYDKKLEASRDDFFSLEWNTRDVDCVLTTGELFNLLADKNVDLALVEGLPLDALLPGNALLLQQQQQLCAASDVGASGGYLENIFRHAARTLFNVDFPLDAVLPYKVGRNADYKEVFLEVNGEKVLRFATAYGFRNIQNVCRQLKSNTCRLHYVEVMACPGGCLNGGGQPKPEAQAQEAVDPKVHLRVLDARFHEVERGDPADNAVVSALYAAWVGDLPGTPRARALFHTNYHAVAKSDINPLAIRW